MTLLEAQSIPGATNRLDERWPDGIVAELAAQVAKMDVDHVLVPDVVHSPDPIQKLLPAEHDTRFLREREQEVELDRSQRERVPAERHCPGRLIDDERAEPEAPSGPSMLRSRLTDAGVLLGIVSGALEAAVHIKLPRAGLNRFFSFGGYGFDSSDRAELTRLAIERAGRIHGHTLDTARLLVVGDTPRDIDAAHAGSAGAVLTTALYSRFTSLGEADFADKILSAMRPGFGGHIETKG